MSGIERRRYAALYGPTAGDRIRLADTNLLIEVEEDRCGGGDEAVFGGGKVIRESMPPAVTIMPSPAIASVPAPIGMVTPGWMSGLPALPIFQMRPSLSPMSALTMPQ